MASFDPVEWDDSKPIATSDPDALSEPEENQDSVQVSEPSSSNWEAVT